MLLAQTCVQKRAVHTPFVRLSDSCQGMRAIAERTKQESYESHIRFGNDFEALKVDRLVVLDAGSASLVPTYSDALFPLYMTARLRPARLASYIALSAASTRLKEDSSRSGMRVAPPTLMVT